MPALYTTDVHEALAVLGGYLLGSVPFSLLIGFAVGRVDIRTVGSGNVGATNVGRAVGRPWALVAFALDFAKGWLPGTLALSGVLGLAAGREHALAVLTSGAAVCGHVWPLFLRFKGGKGVATGCGGIVALDPVIFLCGGAAWLLTLGLTRYVGLASMVMGLAFPLAAWWRVGGLSQGPEVVAGALALTALVFARHRANMIRMWRGTEPKFGRRREVTGGSE